MSDLFWPASQFPGHSYRQQAGGETMAHRLTGPEVGGQRQRGQQLGDTKLRVDAAHEADPTDRR
jgi:hypothetical protein